MPRVRNIRLTWILAGVFAYLPLFIFQILDITIERSFDFYFDLIWMAWHWKSEILNGLTFHLHSHTKKIFLYRLQLSISFEKYNFEI